MPRSAFSSKLAGALSRLADQLGFDFDAPISRSKLPAEIAHDSDSESSTSFHAAVAPFDTTITTLDKAIGMHAGGSLFGALTNHVPQPRALQAEPRRRETSGEVPREPLSSEGTISTVTAPTTPRSRGRAAIRARTAVLFSRLQELGLRGIEGLVLMRTRTVMVSLIGRTLRVHEGYADAPEPVLRAIVAFATARTRAARNQARDAILAHDVERAPAVRRAEAERPGDAALVSSLVAAHAELNARWFDGTLTPISIRLSGRMATRLGHFDPGSRLTPSEIVMSRTHIVRHGWREGMHTLLHEMVHQWQHETGRPVDHLAAFRKKCREVGITPSARRDVVPLKARKSRGAA